MSLIHADNFSIYGTDEAFLLNGIYAQADAMSLENDPDGISGGKVASITGAGQNNEDQGLRFVLPSNQNKVGMAQRIWLPALQTGTIPCAVFAQFRDVSNNKMVTITADTTGRLRAHAGDSQTAAVLTTTNPVITANGWYHMEVVVNNTADTVEVRIEGITVLSGTITISADISQVFWGSRTSIISAGYQWYLKDAVIWDGAGSFNNDFLGSVLVNNLVPTADIALNWTPSTGTTGFGILDNIPPVDTTFLSAPYNAGAYEDPYVGAMSDLPVETTSVKGVITFVRAAKSDGGDGTLQVGIISDPSGTPATVLGADRAITVAQTYWRDVFEVDPKTSTLWLPAAVNAAQIQLDRTT